MRIRLHAVALLFLLASAATAQVKPWPIRAVIVATFEIGNDTGDAPGEFQFWAEREHLDEVVEFPGGVHPLRTNKDHTVLGMVSGTTLVNATASMMALGLDPRFDLTHAYWLLNGIAGVDPKVASMGSAAWASFVINDVAREIDARDAPADWPYGFFPVDAHSPTPAAVRPAGWFRSNSYPLNAKLAAWAFAQTKDLKLGDDPKVAAYRAEYTGYPNAVRPPFVVMGDSFASDYFWHGKILNQFAEDWVKLFTEGKGVFVMTEMEDSGFMNALERLDKMHRVDHERAMVLRSGSNYTLERPGHTAVESLTEPYIGKNVALESAWLCGSTVLHWLLDHWDQTSTHIPGG